MITDGQTDGRTDGSHTTKIMNDCIKFCNGTTISPSSLISHLSCCIALVVFLSFLNN